MSNNNQETPSPEQIAGTISAMRDSVWVIDSEMEKAPSKETLESIGRNVGHLELVMTDENIVGSGEDLSDITEAIVAGKAFQDEHKLLLDT